jgi:hypothetical protein
MLHRRFPTFETLSIEDRDKTFFGIGGAHLERTANQGGQRGRDAGDVSYPTPGAASPRWSSLFRPQSRTNKNLGKLGILRKLTAIMFEGIKDQVSLLTEKLAHLRRFL